VARITPDDLAELSTEQSLTYIGAIKINLHTGEPFLEPRHLLDSQVAEVCALFTS
jgi:hypothetical protein